MPTYEYACAKCDHRFDMFQPISEKPITVCPEDLCARKKWGRGKVKRVIGSGAGIIFKGTGFYTTDYRSEQYKEAAKKEAPAPPAAGESKPAEAAPAKAKESAPAKSEPKEPKRASKKE